MSIVTIISGLQADQLKDIDLSNIKLTSPELRLFLEAVKRNKSLQSLAINISHIDTESLTLLIGIIKQHAHIQNLMVTCKNDGKTTLLESAFKDNNKINLKINILSKSHFGFFKKINTISNQEIENNSRSENYNNQPKAFLPHDVMIYIFKSLNEQDLLRVANTSKKWALKLTYYYYKYKGQDTLAAQLYTYIQDGKSSIKINYLLKNTLMQDFFLQQKTKLAKKIEAIPTTIYWEEIYKPFEIPITAPLNKADNKKYEKYQKQLIDINLNINRLSNTIQCLRYQL